MEHLEKVWMVKRTTPARKLSPAPPERMRKGRCLRRAGLVAPIRSDCKSNELVLQRAYSEINNIGQKSRRGELRKGMVCAVGTLFIV
jgi:hypothetical protein